MIQLYALCCVSIVINDLYKQYISTRVIGAYQVKFQNAKGVSRHASEVYCEMYHQCSMAYFGVYQGMYQRLMS